MRILSIETSCDETSIAIMEVSGGIQSASFKVLAHHTSSQIDVHIPYGGVYPALAKREHIKNLPMLLEKVLKKAKTSPPSPSPKERGSYPLGGGREGVDLIAITYGPGLEPALWTGIVFAQELAKKWSAGQRSAVPVIPVNHMEGHIFSVFAKRKKFTIPKVKFPILSLLVSGGHTELVLSRKWLQYEIIGETLDDAVGEAFDKVARMLGLPYPGGPEISLLAEAHREKEKQFLRGVSQADGPRGSAPRTRGDSDPAKTDFSFSLPRPMLKSKNFNFSFSGLKTAVLYLLRDLAKKHSNILQNDKIKKAIALEFENAAVECLTYKTAGAIEKYKIKTLIVGGGVSANAHLRKEIKKVAGKNIALHFPPKELTGDNALMIGIAGYLEYLKNKKRAPKPESIVACGNLSL